MEFKARFLLLAVSVIIIGCSRQKTPTTKLPLEDQHVQAALDELRKLQSYAEAGLNKTEYSERFLNSNASIDVMLDKASDADTAKFVRIAVGYYKDARDGWGDQNRLQRAWLRAARAAHIAKEFAAASAEERPQIAAAAEERIAAASRSIEDAEKVAKRQEMQYNEQRLMDEQRTAAAQQQAAGEAKRLVEEEQRKQQAMAESARQAAQAQVESAYSPGGVVYATRGLSATTDSGIIGIPPGTKLEVLARIDKNTLKVRCKDIEITVYQNTLTHDPKIAQQLIQREMQLRQQAYEREQERLYGYDWRTLLGIPER